MNEDMLDLWLQELARKGWTFYYFPNREDPRLVAATLPHQGGIVDVIALFDPETALAYRAPIEPNGDPFIVDHVTYAYAGEPVFTVMAALSLPAPGMPGEPVEHQSAPPLCSTLAELATRNRVMRPPNR